MNFLVGSVGMKRGSKVNASIPRSVFSKQKFMKSLLRGLFDTDGCLKFSKQSKKTHYYPRVQIALRSSPLALQLGSAIKKAEFKFGSWKDNRFNGVIFYQISGKENAHRWFEEISPRNPVHTTKYMFWKKFGHYVPRSSLEFREKMLTNFINNQ